MIQQGHSSTLVPHIESHNRWRNVEISNITLYAYFHLKAYKSLLGWFNTSQYQENHGESFQLNRSLIIWQLFYLVKILNQISFFLQNLLPLCTLTFAPWQMVFIFWLEETDLVLTIFTIYKSCHCIKFLFNWKDSPWFFNTDKHWISP